MAANQGEVDIPLGTLRCTLRASKEVSAYFGNFVSANERVARFEQEAITRVIAAGLGKKPEDIEQAVYDAGLLSLNAPVQRWLDLLANGGRKYEPPAPDAPDVPGNA